MTSSAEISALLKVLRLRFVMVCVFCGLSSRTVAQQPVELLLVGVDHRPATSLNGDWHYLVDQPPARGLYTSEGKVRDNGYALNTHPNINTGPHNDEYDFATAPTLRVPGDWNTQDATLFRYEGVVWYQRNFEYHPIPDKRTFLHIGAANYKSFVWVNQKAYLRPRGRLHPIRL